MKAGRKPAAAAKPVVEIETKNVRRDLDAVDVVAEATAAFGAEQAHAFITLGRLQMAGGFKEIALAAEIKQYAEIRETKAFKYLPIQRADGISAPAKNFEEFCDLTHRQGYKGVMEQLQYLRALGYPVYEALKNLNIDRKQFRLLLAAPDDKRAQLIAGEAVDLTDPDAVRDHIEALADELQKAASEADEARAENVANIDLLADAHKRADELERELRRLPEIPVWSDAVAALTMEVATVTNDIVPLLGALHHRITQVADLMLELNPSEEEGRATAIQMINAVHVLVNLLGPLQVNTYAEFKRYVPVTHTSLYTPSDAAKG